MNFLNPMLSPVPSSPSRLRKSILSPPPSLSIPAIAPDNEENQNTLNEKSGSSSTLLSAAVSPTSPGSPSMTQRRGINLRIQVIPPDSSSESDDEHDPYSNNRRLNGNRDWSTPPLLRPQSSLEAHNNMRYLQLPPNPELSPAYYSSKNPTQDRRHSASSYCSECLANMSSSPSTMSLSSSISFVTSPRSTVDGPLSPYFLPSPTFSRSPSACGCGWRDRAYTTVQHRRHRPSVIAASSVDGPPSPPIGASSPGGHFGSTQLRSSRSWTFVGPSSVWASSGRQGNSPGGAAPGSGGSFGSGDDCAFGDRGMMWTPPPPPQAPSPHPLGYYSDSPPPLYSSSFVSGRSGGGSPLLASKMMQRTSSDSGDHPSPPAPPSLLLHRASISGGSSQSGRRFSTSLHQPQYYQHCYHPPTHQYHHAGHQQHAHLGSAAASFCHQRMRRDSTGFGPVCTATYSTGTGSSWESPTGSSSNLHRMRHHLGQSCPQLSSLVGSSGSNSASASAGASPGGHLVCNFGLLAPGNIGGGLGPAGHPVGGPAVKLRREISIQRRHSHRMSRRSFHANTSPIMGSAAAAAAAAGAAAGPYCRSPRQGSPVMGQPADAGGALRPSTSHGNQPPQLHRHHQHHHCANHQGAAAQAHAAPLRQNSLRVQHPDARRWSVASLPSSGYGTPGSSAMSSQYSSHERLAAALEEQRYHYGSNDSNPSAYAAEYVLYAQAQQTPPAHCQHQQQLHIHQHGQQADFQTPCPLSPRSRIRSRSLSSLAWLNLSSSRLDNSSSKIMSENVEVALRNNIYKEKFPKAKRQMEEKLEAFLADNALLSSSGASSSYHLAALSTSTGSDASPSATPPPTAATATVASTNSSLTVQSQSFTRQPSVTSPVVAVDADALKLLSDGSARFIHLQIMEQVADCLQKSKNDALTSAYFYELSENLEDLLEEAKEKATPEAFEQLSTLVKKVLIIVSRPARLLECLEFDPEEFYRLLQEAEGQAKEAQRSGQGESVPQYIIRQLGLGRQGALPDLPGSLVQSTDSGHSTETPARSASVSVATPSSASPGTNRRRPAPPKEDDFEIIKLISNGAYGAVFLVRHRETRRRFALKKLNKSNLMLRNQIDQVYAERDILTFTDNPFVVSFYGSFETKRHLCMLMEYVEGGDCATLLKNTGVLPVELARLYIAETVLAIEYLHSYGIVHRDLKPDNLLITALGHIKLTDFGLSKIGLMNRTNLLYEGYFDALMTETTQFQDRQICGTPEYIAPEVILRQGYGKPVDWWALGVILYEFLVGTVPFFGETPEELFSHVINDEIEWPEEPYAPPEEAQDLVIGLLQQNPLERLGTVNGALELKEHKFFESLDWNSLLRQKAEFIPQLEGEDDTSYFDTRVDRYHHDLDSADDDGSVSGDLEVASIKESSSALFASFSSCSPRFSMLADQAIAKSGSESFFGGHNLDHSDSMNSSGASVVMEPALISPSASLLTAGLPAPVPVAAQPRGHQLMSPSFRQLQSASSIADAVKPATHEHGETKSAEVKLIDESISASRAAVEQIDVGAPSLKVLQAMSANDEAQIQWRRRTNAMVSQSRQAIPATVVSAAYPITASNDLSSASTATLLTCSTKSQGKELSPVEEAAAISPTSPPSSEASTKPQTSMAAATSSKPIPQLRQTSLQPNQHQQAVHRQLSAPSGRPHHPTQGLHLVIPGEISTATPVPAPQSPTCSSGGSSRDGSPTGTRRRRITAASGMQEQHSGGSAGSATTIGSAGSGSDTHVTTQLKAPIVIKRGPKGFGFTIRAIRVYLGESDYYTIQHLVMSVELGSPACDAGLRANDLITHVNGESVQNLTHPEVVQRLMSGTDSITLRVSPLESTTIRQDGPARKNAGKLVKRSAYKQKLQKRALDKTKKKTSLFRRLSGKRVSAELSAAGIGPSTTCGLLATASTAAALAGMTSGNLSHLTSLQRSLSHNEGALSHGMAPKIMAAPSASSPIARTRLDSSSSQSSSPVSSVPNSPALTNLDMVSCASVTPPSTLSPSSAASTPSSSSSRPSSLHGLKHKLAQTLRSPSRRKHAQTMPLSPLARAQPPAASLDAPVYVGQTTLTAGHISPSRSPSPLAIFGPSASVSATVKSPPMIVPMVKKTITKPKKSDSSSISSASSGTSAETPSKFLLRPSSKSPLRGGDIRGNVSVSNEGATKKTT